MIWSPLSELPAIGRAPVYLLTLAIFVFFEFAVIYPTNFGMLMAFRFLTGFIGSPALATGAASMADMWSPKLRDYMIVVWGMFAISAPVLGPSIGMCLYNFHSTRSASGSTKDTDKLSVQADSQPQLTDGGGQSGPCYGYLPSALY